MNIHFRAILMFTRVTRFWAIPITNWWDQKQHVFPGRVQRPGPEATCFRPVFGARKVFQGEMFLERSGKLGFWIFWLRPLWVSIPRFCAKNSEHEGNELEIARKKIHISDHFQTARKEFCRKTRQAYCCILVAWKEQNMMLFGFSVKNEPKESWKHHQNCWLFVVVCPAVGNHTFTTFKSDAQAPWLWNSVVKVLLWSNLAFLSKFEGEMGNEVTQGVHYYPWISTLIINIYWSILIPK